MVPNSGYVSSHIVLKKGNIYIVKIFTKKSHGSSVYTPEKINMIRLALCQRLNIPVEKINIVCSQINENAISSSVMADKVKEMLEMGFTPRRAAQATLTAIMKCPASPIGAEIIISGIYKQFFTLILIL